MSKNVHPAPPDSFRELVYKAGERWYFKEIPENKKRQNRADAIGYNSKNKTNCRSAIRIDGFKYLVARVIYWLETNEWPVNVGFKDGDHTNYSPSNLIPTCGRDVNLRRSENMSVYKNRCGRWEARVNINKKNIFIGTYETRDLALIASWRVREALYPGVCPPPEKELKNAVLTEMVNMLKSVIDGESELSDKDSVSSQSE